MYASLDFPENTVYKFIHELELVGYLPILIPMIRYPNKIIIL